MNDPLHVLMNASLFSGPASLRLPTHALVYIIVSYRLIRDCEFTVAPRVWRRFIAWSVIRIVSSPFIDLREGSCFRHRFALRCVVLCFVLSCIVLSCLVVSCRVVSCRVLSCLVVSYRIVSYRIVSYLIVSYRIVSYRIVSYRIVSYRIVSYRIVSYRIVSYCIVNSLIGGNLLTKIAHMLQPFSVCIRILPDDQLTTNDCSLNIIGHGM